MSRRKYYKKRPIIGPVEEILLARRTGKKKHVLARIDTGADYSSICEKLAMAIGFKSIVIELQKLKHIIRNPIKNYKPERELLNRIKGVKGAILIRSAAGRTRRVFVPLKIELGGKIIRTKVTIIERTHMEYPMIVGRKDLQKAKFIVDPLRRR